MNTVFCHSALTPASLAVVVADPIRTPEQDPMETQAQAHRKWEYWTGHTAAYVVIYGAGGRWA